MVLCTVLMNGERVLMKNKNTQTKVYKQYLSKCVGGIARSYSVLQDKFATALQNNPDVKEFRLNVEVSDSGIIGYSFASAFKGMIYIN
jgi:hypothetical protein